jgi:hypothetical protein
LHGNSKHILHTAEEPLKPGLHGLEASLLLHVVLCPGNYGTELLQVTLVLGNSMLPISQRGFVALGAFEVFRDLV